MLTDSRAHSVEHDSAQHLSAVKQAAENGGPGTVGELNISDQPFRLIGSIILLITFGLFGGWAAFAPLESAVLAPGVVTVKNYRKDIRHLEGGIVRKILVHDGDFVHAGDPLILLDDTQYRAEQKVLTGQFITLKALEARLLSERDGVDQVFYPDELTSLRDPRVGHAIAGQDQVFLARISANEGERAVLEQRIQQLQVQIAGIQAVHESNVELMSSFEVEIAELRQLLDQGFTGKQRLTDLERERAKLVGLNAEALSEMAGLEMRAGETRLQILQFKKYQQTEIVDELGDVQPKLFDIIERMRVIEDKVERTTIRAPVDGVILAMNVHTVGGVVTAASTLLEIVPEDQQLVVDAEVSPVDIDRVREGMEAKVRFSAFKSRTTPMIDGVIVNISADRLVNQANGGHFYLAQVEVGQESLRGLNDLKLVPGMPAEVLIGTGNRTLLQYIVQPASNVIARSLIED